MRARTLEVVTRLIGLCAELGGSVLVHGSPKQRAIAAGETHATARGRLIEFLADAARVAAAHGVTYCIEPLGRAETALINTVAEAAEVVRAVDSPALRTMIDCSAAGATEAQSVPELIDTWLPTGLIAHVQVNDPNRRAPGPGRDEVRADLRGAEAQRLRRGRSRSSRSTTSPTARAPPRSPPAICAAFASPSPSRITSGITSWRLDDSDSSCTASPAGWG